MPAMRGKAGITEWLEPKSSCMSGEKAKLVIVKRSKIAISYGNPKNSRKIKFLEVP